MILLALQEHDYIILYLYMRCASFVAQVIVLSDPRAGAIHAGSELTVLCRLDFLSLKEVHRGHAAQVQCAVEELLSRTDRRTGRALYQPLKVFQVAKARC